MAAANPAGPLVGIRVLELSVAIAGPATAGILSDWGATVTRVEFGKGDYNFLQAFAVSHHSLH